MSQDGALRMAATVVDGFSGPLKNLRAQMQGLAKEGAGHNETLEKSFGKVTGGVRAAEQAVASGLNPGLKALGVTSLGATAAIAGIGAALRSFASGASSIGQLSRDTNIGAQQLREVQGVLGKVGVDAATSGQALQQFAENARLARNGVGPLVDFLSRQGRSAEGRAYFQGLLRDIMRSKDAGEALDKAMRGMEGVKDPVDRRKYAEEVLRIGDAARLVGGPLGTLQQQFEKFRATNGILSPKDIEAAERYQRALSDLGSSMAKFGTVIAIELAGPAEKVASALAGIVSNERGGALLAIREGLQGVKTELGKIDWEAAGKDGLAFLREGTALAGSLARALHEVAEAVRQIRQGEHVQALRGLDGASGPLARKLAPRVGDDEIAAQESVDRLKAVRDLAREAAEHFIGRTQQRMGLLDTPEAAQGKLDAAEAELRRLQARSPEDRKRDFEASEKLRQSIDKLGEKVDAARGANGSTGGASQDALLQLQSYGGGTGIGALIQKASLGGRPYGAGGAGTLGERLFGQPTGSAALGDPYRERRMQALLGDPSAEWRMRILRGERGVPLPGGAGASDRGFTGRPFGAPKIQLPGPDTPAGRIGRELRGETGGDQGMLDLITRAEGTRGRGYNDSFAHQVPGSLTDKSLAEIEAIQRGMRGSSAIGKYQFMRGTLFGGRSDGGLVGELGLSRDEKFTPELQDRLANHLIERRYRRARRLQSQDGGDFMRHFRTELAREWASFPGDYGQQGVNGGMYPGQRASVSRDQLTHSALRWLDQREGRTASDGGRPSAEVSADGLRQTRSWQKTEVANGPAFAAAYRAREAAEAERRKGFELSPKVQEMIRSQVNGGSVTADGRVNISVLTRDPNPQVRSSASGNLFREIVQSKGRQMAPSDGV